VTGLRIAIAGYGIAGIATALFLRRLGHTIEQFEQAREPAFAGGGLLLQRTGLSVLGDLGLRDAALACGAPVTRVTAELRGRMAMDLQFEPGDFALGLQRAALFRILRGADTAFAALRTGQTIVGADAERGILRTMEGEIGPFDLIVGADGVNSSIRNALAPLVLRNRPYASDATLCLLDDPDGRFTGAVAQHFAGGGHVSIWPVGSLAPGETPRINVSLRTDEGADWAKEVSQLCPALAPLLGRTPHLLSASYRDVWLTRYYGSRVALLGDAAHAMSPQLGQGASMALLDARALAASLERYRSVPDALAAFDRSRRRHVGAYQRLSRMATPVFQSAHPLLTNLRDRLVFPASRLPVVRRPMLRALAGGLAVPAI
jgi:2-polyprenyl-6-methoxyphenol hydroxylase-like FAD-dependent oxidoreductase